jgi:hypothetical protein
MGEVRLAGLCAAASGFGSDRYKLVATLSDAIARSTFCVAAK